jgi:hypothetical protein
MSSKNRTQPPRKAKKQKVNADDEKIIVAALMEDALEFIVPFVSIQDVNDGLSLASRRVRACVNRIRPPSHYIVAARRESTKIGFENTDIGWPNRQTVWQIHNFQFKLCTPAIERMTVDVKLVNSVWEEEENRHCGVYRPSPTKVRFVVYDEDTPSDPALFVRSYQNIREGCECDGSHCFYCNGFRIRGFDSSGTLASFGGEAELKGFGPSVRLSLASFYECAKRIASFPGGTAYPSAEYLMRTLPASLHPFFPHDFDWGAGHKDRNLTVEFGYRAAASLDEWLDFIPPEFDGIHESDVEEVPWYRNDYWWEDGDDETETTENND